MDNLSLTMKVYLGWLALDCECTTCTYRFVSAAETIVLQLIDEDYKLPIINCPYCKKDTVVYSIIHKKK